MEDRAKGSINKETPINLVRAHLVTHITNLHITRETLINHDLLWRGEHLGENLTLYSISSRP